MMDTLAAICSAIAAVASAVAAFLLFTLAKRTAAQTLEAERRNLEHDIEEIARTVQVESQRATRVYQQVKPIQDSLSAIVGRFGGIGHSEAGEPRWRIGTGMAPPNRFTVTRAGHPGGR
jgi:hypothetical protein